jgi:high-affinity K+ transport system ATPase subunit B
VLKESTRIWSITSFFWLILFHSVLAHTITHARTHARTNQKNKTKTKTKTKPGRKRKQQLTGFSSRARKHMLKETSVTHATWHFPFGI